MSVKYKYSGLTKELYQRLVSEHAALKQTHSKDYKQFFQEVRQCSEVQARIIYQAFNSAVVERERISPRTVDRLEGIISDELFNDLQAYLSENYSGKCGTGRREVDKTNAGLTEELFQQYRMEIDNLRAAYPNSIVARIMEVKGCSKREAMTIQSAINSVYVERANLMPRKVIQLEGLLSRELFSEIARYVFNNYEWPESLDSEIDRITLEYRTKGKIGRNKMSVRKALYTAYMLGV